MILFKCMCSLCQLYIYTYGIHNLSQLLTWHILNCCRSSSLYFIVPILLCSTKILTIAYLNMKYLENYIFSELGT